MMIVVAGLATVLAGLATHHSRVGCGHSHLPLSFQIVDDRDGRPVVGAKIELISDFGRPPDVSEITGKIGELETIVGAGHTTYNGPFLRRYRVIYVDSYALRIEAEGYERLEAMLSEYMKDPAYHSDRTPHPPVVVRLKRKAGVNSGKPEV
jgi:hypothetical protein